MRTLAQGRKPGSGRKPIPIEQRFWNKVDIRGKDECWNWTAAKNKLGYGFVMYNRVCTQAYRVAWVLTYGGSIHDVYLCHKCNNPSCVNPKHLYAGSHAENMRDKVAAGTARGLIGSKNPKAKLSERDVVKIKRELSRGVLVSKIANEYHIGWNAIWRIKRGIYWGHVGGDK